MIRLCERLLQDHIIPRFQRLFRVLIMRTVHKADVNCVRPARVQKFVEIRKNLSDPILPGELFADRPAVFTGKDSGELNPSFFN